MKRHLGQIVLTLLLLRLAIGCGTIMHGTTQDIQISSSPDNGEIWIDGAKVGSTPGRITLKRKTDHIITIKREGFKEATAKIENKSSAWIIGNIIFGGIPGCVIDLVTGGAYELSPDRLDINLTKLSELDGKTIPLDQAQLEAIKEVRLINEMGVPETVIHVEWMD